MKISKYTLFGVTKFDEWVRIVSSSSYARITSLAFNSPDKVNQPYVRLVIVKEVGTRLL